MSNNSVKYHFADFTYDNYRRLIQIAKAKFSFKNYLSTGESDSFLNWRHDLDGSVHSAQKMAEIEAQENIRATYFILLNCDFYNVFESEIRSLIDQIIGLGHEIGLHFDSTAYSIQSVSDLEKWLSFEKNILEVLFKCKISAFSFHVPNEMTAKFEAKSYAGLINCYSKFYKTEVAYCSDSNGYWRFKRLEDVLTKENPRQLQVLTHPEHWQDRVMSPKERIQRCVQGRAKSVYRNYESRLKSQGRKVIDWNEVIEEK